MSLLAISVAGNWGLSLEEREREERGAWQWFWGGFGLGVLYQLIRNPQGCGCYLGVLALLLLIGLIAAWVFRDAVILIAGLGLLAYLGYRWWRSHQARD